MYNRPKYALSMYNTEINFSQLRQSLESVSRYDFNFIATQPKFSQINQLLEVFFRNFMKRAATCLIGLQIWEFPMKWDGEKFDFSIVRKVKFIDLVVLSPGKNEVGRIKRSVVSHHAGKSIDPMLNVLASNFVCYCGRGRKIDDKRKK